MDLRVFRQASGKDISAYAPPESTELFGKEFTASFGGERMTLAFSKGGQLRSFKIREAVWLITAPVAFYLLDMGAGMITRAVPDAACGFALSFGSSTEAAAAHKLSDDLDGNTMEWVFGHGGESAITERVTGGEAVITRPRAPDAQAVTTSKFRAVKITDTVYLQTAAIECGGKVMSACLVSDFYSLLCAGAIYGADGVVNIGGYGRIVPGA